MRAGFDYLSRDLFLQGFSSLAIPADQRDVTYAFNSLAVGYWAYRDPGVASLITGVVPTVELHVNTPLNHRGDGVPFDFNTNVNVTTGVHIELFRRALWGVAVVVPVTSPRPFDFEVITNLNLRF